MQRRRSVTLVLVLALVVLAAGVGWVAGTLIQSPAEAAARTAPPTPSPILAPVEERVLTSAIVTRGTARYGLPQAVTLAPSALKAAVGLITTLPVRNTQVKEGDLLLTASGRPVFVLQGEIPVYRDLTPGSTGADIQQFEAALKRLGLDPGPLDGLYDEQTSTAVAAWYAAAGWAPFAATTAQRAALSALEEALAVAYNKQAMAEDTAAAAPLAVAAAQAAAESDNQVAAAVVAAQHTAYTQLLADTTADVEARAQAKAELALAQAAANAAQLAGEVAIRAALNAQKVAEREVQLAGENVARLTAELDQARGQTGIQVPADELVFISDLPVRVEQVTGRVGDAAAGPLLMVTNNQLAVDSSLPLDEAPLVKLGMPVAIDEPELGIQATGKVVRVADLPGSDGVDGYHIYFETWVDETPTAIDGLSVRLTIPVQSTEGAVTVVPISALSLRADGTSIVQVDNYGMLTQRVVEPGLAADGFVAVTPLDGALAPGQLVLVGYENLE